MGQELSEPIDESIEPLYLKRRDLKSIAEYIASGECQKVAVMVGAGISTSAGIPDFRSPDTGLYANLKRLDLPEPEAVFDITYFRTNPLPFYTLAHDLYPGKYRPTITHSFIHLLHKKGILKMCWTQNIDTLERAAGVPGEKLVEAHGSFASQRCIECKAPYPDDWIKQHILANPVEIPTCKDTPECNGLVKPDIVFFGEPLPAEFSSSMEQLDDVDLAIVMGTSLMVYPFAGLPTRVPHGPPRLLINNEKVGEIGSRRDDVIFLKECDEAVKILCKEIGWLDELEKLWADTEPEESRVEKERWNSLTLDQRLDEEVERLTKDVEESLKVSKDHKGWVEGQLAKEKGEDTIHDAEPGSPTLSYKPTTIEPPKPEAPADEVSKVEDAKTDPTKTDPPKTKLSKIDTPKTEESKDI
ncbi:Sir2 histone deacetylase Hst2 [Arthrobotrys conoides]|uniref:Sir2 histone deacetylase Hst2 n=1 Tax=Arthrobotrys conoides TaxID=74498 RepID=A0AAN8NF76_9PEZI